MLSWIRQEKVTAVDTTLSITLLRQLSYLSHCLSTTWLSLSKYLKESDLEYLVASPVGDALLSSPGSSRAIQTNSHFLPVFQPLCHSVFQLLYSNVTAITNIHLASLGPTLFLSYCSYNILKMCLALQQVQSLCISHFIEE